MRVMSKWSIGCVAMVAAIGMVNAPGGFAADASSQASIERHGAGSPVYSASQPMFDGAGICVRSEGRQKVEITERIGHGGSTYRSAKVSDCEGERKQVDIVQRIGQGGSSYSFSHTMNN